MAKGRKMDAKIESLMHIRGVAPRCIYGINWRVPPKRRWAIPFNKPLALYERIIKAS